MFKDSVVQIYFTVKLFFFSLNCNLPYVYYIFEMVSWGENSIYDDQCAIS